MHAIPKVILHFVFYFVGFYLIFKFFEEAIAITGFGEKDGMAIRIILIVSIAAVDSELRAQKRFQALRDLISKH